MGMCRAEGAWPRCAGLRGHTPAPGRRPGFQVPTRVRLPFPAGPGPICWSSQHSTALGIRLSGGLSRATKSSQRASLSVLHRMVMCADPEDGRSESARSKRPRASVMGHSTGRWGRSQESYRQGSRSHNLERLEEPPTSVQPQVPKPLQRASTQPRLIEHSDIYLNPSKNIGEES
jgi:hypothetical protein